ncbi:MAG: HMA2 domain-containing protein [Syntrophobacteraceae bacterium]
MDRIDSQVVDNLLLLAPHTEIVHHIPGRIRLRVARSGIQLATRIDVQALLRAIPGILQVRVNPVVGSVVVDYDSQKLPSTPMGEAWEAQVRCIPSASTEARPGILELKRPSHELRLLHASPGDPLSPCSPVRHKLVMILKDTPFTLTQWDHARFHRERARSENGAVNREQAYHRVKEGMAWIGEIQAPGQSDTDWARQRHCSWSFCMGQPQGRPLPL